MAEVSKVSPNVNNYAMPRGRLSFAPMADDGTMKGEIDLGNVVAFDLTNSITWKEHETSQEGVVILDAKKPAAQKWSVKFTPEERSKENMALFFLGDPNLQKGSTPDVFAQTGENVLAQGGTVYLNRWIDLGFKYIKPGSWFVDDQNVDDFTCGTVRTDYENGLIMFLEGSKEDKASVVFSFKYGTCSLPKITTRTKAMVGFLRYRGVSEVGPRHEIKCWKVQITPDAAMNFIKPQDYAGLSFSGDLYKNSGTCSSIENANPFFQIVELGEATSYPS